MAKNLSTADFKTEVLGGKGVYLVDFWAEWCAPCRALAPILDQVATDFEGKITVAKVNIDNENEIAQMYGVMSIPTLILFKDGEAVDKITGLRPKNLIAEFVNNNL